MSRLAVNLARRPFLNDRPVARAAALLWVVGALLLAGNVWLYWSYFVGSGETAGQLDELSRRVTEERHRLAEFEGELAKLDLAQQNQTVHFLNGKIAERSFAWGRLFDQLAEIFPPDARLQSLTPGTDKDEARARAAALPGAARRERVKLHITGEAKTDEALLALVDALFAHPAFEEPDLEREARQETRTLLFEIETAYLPAAGASGAAPPAAGSSGGPPAVGGEAAPAADGGAP